MKLARRRAELGKNGIGAGHEWTVWRHHPPSSNGSSGWSSATAHALHNDRPSTDQDRRDAHSGGSDARPNQHERATPVGDLRGEGLARAADRRSYFAVPLERGRLSLNLQAAVEGRTDSSPPSVVVLAARSPKSGSGPCTRTVVVS